MTSPKWGPGPIAVWIRERLEQKGESKTWLEKQLEAEGMTQQSAKANLRHWTIHETTPGSANLAMLAKILDSEPPLLIEVEAYRDHESRIASLEDYRETIRQLAAAVPEDQALLQENGELRELLRRLSAPG